MPINHIEGHLLSPMIGKKLVFPFLGLVVSGGHTQLILASSIGKYEILGDSLDDAVGEAFDKVANSLGFIYPGGLSLSMSAKHGSTQYASFP